MPIQHCGFFGQKTVFCAAHLGAIEIQSPFYEAPFGGKLLETVAVPL